jgi:manganese efflux pump family protein
MRFATFISWLLTASLGAYMLRTWLVRGGLRRERARPGGLPPQLIFGHAGLAISGLLVWAGYLGTGVRALAWTAVVMLMVTVGLGLSTVTLWTPYPARKPGERRAHAPWDEPAVVVPDTPAAAAEPAQEPDFEITDEMIHRLLEDSYSAGGHRPIRPNPAVLVPIAHGFAAISTFVLAVMAASM